MHFRAWEILRLSLQLQKRSERSHERWRPYSFRTNYSVNSQVFVLVATLTMSSKTLEVKFTERKSALLQNNNVWKKILPFVQSYKVNPPLHHPKNNFMSKRHLIKPLPREIYKMPTLISYILVRSKNLWSRITLYKAYVCVWLVNTLTSTATIVSPIIWCDLQPIFANNGKGIYLSVQQTFVLQERVTNPLRSSAWEAI